MPIDGLRLISPVTVPCRVVAQMTNFASHVKGAGMDQKKFRSPSFARHSIRSIIKPPHVKLLDYEVEIGLVIGRDIPVAPK